MTLKAILLLGLLSMPVAAGAAWLAKRMELGWTARQRVFNAASIAPSIIAMGAVCFAAVILGLGGGDAFKGADNFMLEALLTILVSFDAGLLGAYLIERWFR